jgi:RNA polymerase sigma-70 factor (ECF subfamily)
MNRVLRHLHRAALLCEGGALTDGQLLDCFLSRHDEAAFAALVQRHGPMVFAVCRRVLGNRHDAEDAFQAAFLVLARRAASLRARELLGNWLYGVAYRTALKARVMAARRQARERRAAVRAVAAPAPGAGEELLPLLDGELSRLPEKYRAAVVLCELEGRSRREAAGLLKVPEGTLSSRLAKARKLLAARLARHGLVPAGAALTVLAAAGGASAGVPLALLAGTARSALLVAGGQVATAGLVPAEVAVLTEGVLKTMFLAKVKTTAAVVLSVAVLGLGTGGLVYRARVAASEPPGQLRFQTPAGLDQGQGADPRADRRAEEALREAQARADRAQADAKAAKALAEQERRRAEEAVLRAREMEQQQKAFEKQAAEARLLFERSRLEGERAGRAARQMGNEARPQAVDPEGRLRQLQRSVEERVKALADRRAKLQAEMQEVEAQAKAVMQDYKRQVELLAQTQKAPQQQGDKLDQILERLERLEKRLDRLEQRR